MKPMVKEFHDFLEKQGHRSWDDIEKEMQDELWRIGNKYNVSGPTVFHEYMDWRASQLKKIKVASIGVLFLFPVNCFR
ncbi:hypothetical protein DXY22_01904 [Bacillus subtilis]|uniref:hypothetical protein n=2 Tax=Bacillaceae TaxID=186817 RepID=UPI001362F89C|nr:hypothetical protein [Bacillus subtilis]QHM83832.1 hypothetical protein DXY22_01904 [Bacillus subtilis]